MVTSRDTFLPREAMLLTSASRGPSAIAELLVYRATLCWSVIYYRRVSVCLSHVVIVSKRLNITQTTPYDSLEMSYLMLQITAKFDEIRALTGR